MPRCLTFFVWGIFVPDVNSSGSVCFRFCLVKLTRFYFWRENLTRHLLLHLVMSLRYGLVFLLLLFRLWRRLDTPRRPQTERFRKVPVELGSRPSLLNWGWATSLVGHLLWVLYLVMLCFQSWHCKSCWIVGFWASLVYCLRLLLCSLLSLYISRLIHVVSKAFAICRNIAYVFVGVSLLNRSLMLCSRAMKWCSFPRGNPIVCFFLSCFPL